MSIDYRVVGRRISMLRKRRAITQEKLAEKLGFSKNAIYNIEKGINGVSLSTTVEIVNTLGCTVDDLLEGYLQHQNTSLNDLDMVLEGCSPNEYRFFIQALRAFKRVCEEYSVDVMDKW